MLTPEILKQHHAEELKDAEMYEKMAAENPDYAGIFNDIAHEEKTHANLIAHIMREIG